MILQIRIRVEENEKEILDVNNYHVFGNINNSSITNHEYFKGYTC